MYVQVVQFVQAPAAGQVQQTNNYMHVTQAPASHVDGAGNRVAQAPVNNAEAENGLSKAPVGHVQGATNQMMHAPASHVDEGTIHMQAQQAPPTCIGDQSEDSDVRAESTRVQQSPITALAESEAVVLRGLCKTYGRLVAVDTLNLAIGQGW